MMARYRDWILKVSAKKRSNIVLALDVEKSNKQSLLQECIHILEQVSPLICAVKINQHLVLPLGLHDGVQRIIRRCHELDVPAIIDHKLNDIGNTNRVIATNYFKAGFDAITASPVVGWAEGLDEVFKTAHSTGRGVILVVYMSSKGAQETHELTVEYNNKRLKQYELFVRSALDWDADGIVVGATRPEKIHEISRLTKSKVMIYSPGVGKQGGDVSATVRSGAKFVIVGRSIVKSQNPADAAEQIRESAWPEA